MRIEERAKEWLAAYGHPEVTCPQMEIVKDLLSALEEKDREIEKATQTAHYWQRMFDEVRPDPDQIELVTLAQYEIMKQRAEQAEARCAEYSKDILRLTETIGYLTGIAERGSGYPITSDETVESYVLKYVKDLETRLAAAREGLEEIESMACDYNMDMVKVARQTLEKMGGKNVGNNQRCD